MQYINSYQYNTEQEAINARELCDAYYGIPVTPDDITQNWVDYQFAELNTPQFWYIGYDTSRNNYPFKGNISQALAQQTPFPFIGGDGINILTSSNIITVLTELYTLIDGGLY
jgi:hypothetical protein